jgi:hypothetical protein
MGVLSESMRARALVPLNLTVQVLRPTLASNANLPGTNSLSWAAPTVTATVLGKMQPAGVTARERVGRVGKTGVHEIVTEPATLPPMARVRVGTQQYLILESHAYATHSTATVEEVTP